MFRKSIISIFCVSSLYAIKYLLLNVLKISLYNYYIFCKKKNDLLCSNFWVKGGGSLKSEIYSIFNLFTTNSTTAFSQLFSLRARWCIKAVSWKVPKDQKCYRQVLDGLLSTRKCYLSLFGEGELLYFLVCFPWGEIIILHKLPEVFYQKYEICGCS